MKTGLAMFNDDSSRDITQRQQEVRDAVQLAAHMRREVQDLDDYRKQLAGSDPLHNLLLAQIEERAIQSMQRLHRRFLDERGL